MVLVLLAPAAVFSYSSVAVAIVDVDVHFVQNISHNLIGCLKLCNVVDSIGSNSSDNRVVVAVGGGGGVVAVAALVVAVLRLDGGVDDIIVGISDAVVDGGGIDDGGVGDRSAYVSKEMIDMVLIIDRFL